MKTVTIGTMILAFGLAVTGCGSNTPSDTAKKFVMSVSEANLEEANGMATDTVQQTLSELTQRCRRDEVTVIMQEVIPVLNRMDGVLQSRKYNIHMHNMQTDALTAYRTVDRELNKVYKEKYGSFGKLKEEQIQAMLEESVKKTVSIALPLVDKLVEAGKIESEHMDMGLLKKIASAFMATHQYRSLRVGYRDKAVLSKIIEILAVGNKEGTPLSCVNQHTDFGNVEEINLIEVKKMAPDKSDIRLELIYKNGKAKKVTIHTELIQKVWKVSEMKLR